MLRDSHANLGNALSAKVLEGLQNVCTALNSQSTGDRPQIFGDVDGVIRSSNQQILNHVDTQISLSTQNLVKDTVASFAIIAGKIGELEKLCGALLGRVVNLENGLATHMTQATQKIVGLEQKLASLSLKGPVVMDLDLPTPGARTSSCLPPSLTVATTSNDACSFYIQHGSLDGAPTSIDDCTVAEYRSTNGHNQHTLPFNPWSGGCNRLKYDGWAGYPSPPCGWGDCSGSCHDGTHGAKN